MAGINFPINYTSTIENSTFGLQLQTALAEQLKQVTVSMVVAELRAPTKAPEILPQMKRGRAAEHLQVCRKSPVFFSSAACRVINSFLKQPEVSSFALTCKFHAYETTQDRKNQIFKGIKKLISYKDPTRFIQALELLKSLPMKKAFLSPALNILTDLLFECVHTKNLEYLRIILESGADITHAIQCSNLIHHIVADAPRDANGIFLSEFLQMLPKTELLALLNTQDQEGLTPCMLAALHDNPNVINQLLPYVPHIQPCDKKGYNFLTYLVIGNHPEILSTFLQQLPSSLRHQFVNQKDRQGFTPLMHAIALMQTKIVSILLKETYDRFTCNNAKISPYEFALYVPNKNPEIIDMLERDPLLTVPFTVKKFVHIFSVKPIADFDPQFFSGSFTKLMGENFHRLLVQEDVRNCLHSLIGVPNYETILRAFALYSAIPSDLDKQVHEIQSGKSLVVLDVSWYEHTLNLVFCNGYMVLCNRGEKSAHLPSLFVRKINPLLFKKEHLETIISLSNQSRDIGEPYLYQKLPKELDAFEDCFCLGILEILPKNSRVGNCAYSAIKASFRAAVALLTSNLEMAKSSAKIVSTFHRRFILEELKPLASICPTLVVPMLKIGVDLLQARLQKYPSHNMPFRPFFPVPLYRNPPVPFLATP